MTKRLHVKLTIFLGKSLTFTEIVYFIFLDFIKEKEKKILPLIALSDMRIFDWMRARVLVSALKRSWKTSPSHSEKAAGFAGRGSG